MSMFWSIWVSVLSLGTIFGCIVLLRWCLKNKTGIAEGEAMGHEFDGIMEMNNQLPRWWTIMFYATIVWGLLYLVLYPGLGNYDGLFNWKSSNQGVLSLAESKAAVQQSLSEGHIVQYDREIDKAKARFDPIFEAYAQQSIPELIHDRKAMKVGQRLFLQNCAQCHGSDARGQTGFPNLTDNDWLYGGSPENIKQTLIGGRKGNMLPWLASMGEQGVKEVVTYTLSLSGRAVDNTMADKGKARFGACAACHGADGKGNQQLGAPNLTDNIWLYGGSERAVIETVNYGRNGVMPAFQERLGDDKLHVVAAYIYSLSNDK